jgi:hypothetical protein
MPFGAKQSGAGLPENGTNSEFFIDRKAVRTRLVQAGSA